MEETDENAKLNEELWDSRARTYDRRFSFTRWTQRKLVSMLQLGEDPHLLDLACGTGWAVRYAASLANGHGQFYGVDNSSKMIEQAEANSKNYLNVQFCKSRVEELPFENDFFDFVISSNAFHHFSNPEKALREAKRVLKPKGKVYILDTTANNFFMRMLSRLSRKLEPAHVRLYSTREFQALFEKAGLHYTMSKPILSAIKVHIAEKIQ
jgi:ubiquinone/menaquinone biosynthesis C-methylase UbiE